MGLVKSSNKLKDCDCDICENHEYDLKNRMNLSELIYFINYNRGNITFLDGRRSCITKYNYCPWCGKKIDWNKIKNLIK
jgi:hypothetical protein